MMMSSNSASLDPLIDRLHEDRLKEQIYCDFTISVRSEYYQVHKCVLGHMSKYFAALFRSKLSNKKTVTELNFIRSDTMQKILDFFYTSRVALNDDNIHDVLEAADFLQIDLLLDRCSEYFGSKLETGSLKALINIWVEANKYNLVSLQKRTKNIAINKIFYFLNSKEYARLDVDYFECFLNITCDIISDQMQLFCIMEWMKYVLNERQEHLTFVMESIYEFSSHNIQHFRGKSAICLDVLGFLKTRSKFLNHFVNTAAMPSYPKKSTDKLLFYNGKDVPFSIYNVATNRWFVLEDAEIERLDSRVIAKDNMIYVIGGQVGNTILPQVQTLKLIDYSPHHTHLYPHQEWKEIAPINIKRRNFGCTVWKNCIYIAGGTQVVLGTNKAQYSTLSSVECLDLETGAASVTKMDMNTCRGRVELIACGRYLYALGDLQTSEEDKNGDFELVLPAERYDGEGWTKIPPPKTVMSNATGVALNGRIYALGKDIRRCQNHTIAMETYDPEREEWSKLASMKGDIERATSCVIGGKIYAYGKRPNCQKTVLEVYCHVTNSWKIVNEFDEHRYWSNMTAFE
ncbi:unnamed protein product [Clavelina lepadiformis]